MLLRSGNPTLRAFHKPQTLADLEALQGKSRTMTVQGTVNAAFILVSLCAASALGTWMYLTSQSDLSAMYPLLGVSGLVTLVTWLILWVSPKAAPFVSPVYALSKGVTLGSISLLVALKIGGTKGPAVGVIFQALLLTFGIFGALLLAYTTGLVRVGTTAKRVIVAALGGVLICYLAGFVLSIVGVSVPLFHEMFGFGKAGMIGIGFSAFMLVLGSLFLVWDFQDIEEGAAAGQPKYMEWYGAWSLLVTLIWIYLEALRLLSKLKSRD